MISPEGPSSSDPAATGGGASDHGPAKSFGHTQRYSHSNISLDDQQLQVTLG